MNAAAQITVLDGLTSLMNDCGAAADDAAWRELFGEAGAPAEVHEVHSLEEVPATLFDFTKLLEAMVCSSALSLPC